MLGCFKSHPNHLRQEMNGMSLKQEMTKSFAFHGDKRNTLTVRHHGLAIYAK